MKLATLISLFLPVICFAGDTDSTKIKITRTQFDSSITENQAQLDISYFSPDGKPSGKKDVVVIIGGDTVCYNSDTINRDLLTVSSGEQLIRIYSKWWQAKSEKVTFKSQNRVFIKVDFATKVFELENIYYEIRGNKQYLEQLHQRHKDYAENFDERFDAMVAIDPLTASSEEVWAANLIPFRGWDAAWRLAQAGGVLSEVNYEYAVAITSAYGIQEIYADYGKEYLSVAFNLDYVDPDKIDQVRDSIKATLASFIIFNQTLLNQYDVALTKLEEHPDLNITKS